MIPRICRTTIGQIRQAPTRLTMFGLGMFDFVFGMPRSTSTLQRQTSTHKVPTMATPATVSAAATDADAPGGNPSHTWEDTGGHTWETAVREDADGRIIVPGGDSVANLIRRRRKRGRGDGG